MCISLLGSWSSGYNGVDLVQKKHRDGTHKRCDDCNGIKESAHFSVPIVWVNDGGCRFGKKF